MENKFEITKTEEVKAYQMNCPSLIALGGSTDQDHEQLGLGAYMIIFEVLATQSDVSKKFNIVLETCDRNDKLRAYSAYELSYSESDDESHLLLEFSDYSDSAEQFLDELKVKAEEMAKSEYYEELMETRGY